MVWPVKFNRSVVLSFEFRGLRGVGSSSSLDEVLRLEVDNSRNGRWAVPGVAVMIEFRFEGDHGSCDVFVGELRILANRVISVGMAEMVLRSPTVSS